MNSAAEHWSLIAAVGVAAIVAVAALARRVGVAAPLVLVVVGIGLSWVPGTPRVEIDPDLILTVVLPPILYAAALRMPTVAFRRDAKAIGTLSFLLVAVTTVAVGYLANAVLPGLGLAGAFALGAALGPTDAVAATGIGRRLGLPSRLLVILEGEGLVNDASSLVLLRSAVAAVAGAVSLAHVAGDLAYAVVVAVAVGLVVGHLAVLVRKALRDAVLITAVSFTVPFIAFLPAESLNASGVLAVVVAGMVGGHHDPETLRASDRIAEAINWRTASFLLESGVFLIMGLQLRGLLDQADQAHAGIPAALGLGALAALTVLAVRMLIVAPLMVSLAKDAERAEAAKPVLERLREQLIGQAAPGRRTQGALSRIERRSADVDFVVSERLGWRAGIVLGWSGMRGAITVAAAQSLPADLPLRPQVLLAAFTAALLTLLVPGLSLPAVIRILKVPGDDPDADRAQVRALLRTLGTAGTQTLDAAAGQDAYPATLIAQVRDDLGARHGVRRPANDQDFDPVKWREDYLELMLSALAAERTALIAASRAGTYSTRVLDRVQNRLDLEEARLQQIAAPAE
ncbi:MAG TPA: cation:proton antiporter [Actinospica sp.]|nr:cation:proton antiporter [Actinospica sp.]